MAVTIVYSELARRSLLEIGLYIAERNPEAALRLVDEIQQRLDNVLTVFPEAGPRAGGESRFLTVRGHSALYRFDAVKDEVLVMNVFGPGMDWR